MTITISGTVYKLQDGNRQPLADVTVLAESVQGEPHVTIEQPTDANGAYKLSDLKVGRWRLLAKTKGWATREPVTADFAQDTAGQNLDLFPALRASGTVYWYGSHERVRGAVVKATNAETRKPKFTATNDDGDFELAALEPGKWTFVVMGEESHPTKPEEHDLAEDKTNFRFELFRLEGTPDEKTGLTLFYALMGALGVLVVLYVVLHWWLPPIVVDNTTSSYFWGSEPMQYAEIFFWGLAGILVSKIIEIGSFLRWRKFYREGLTMHIAHVITVPVLALVTAILLAQFNLSFSLADNNATLDLSNPALLAALAFVIGTVPWKVWGFIQSTAEQVTSRLNVTGTKEASKQQPTANET